jgi:hypothetical protein
MRMAPCGRREECERVGTINPNLYGPGKSATRVEVEVLQRKQPKELRQKDSGQLCAENGVGRTQSTKTINFNPKHQRVWLPDVQRETRASCKTHQRGRRSSAVNEQPRAKEKYRREANDSQLRPASKRRPVPDVLSIGVKNVAKYRPVNDIHEQAMTCRREGATQAAMRDGDCKVRVCNHAEKAKPQADVDEERRPRKVPASGIDRPCRKSKG